MGRFIGLLVGGSIFVCALAFVPAVSAQSQKAGPFSLRLVAIEAKLEVQQEAMDRQTDAFEAAASRIEFVNAALVAFLALAGIFAAFMATRWVRDFTEKSMNDRVDQAIERAGREVFAASSQALTEEYEAKFTQLYQRYEGLVEREK